MYIQINTYIHYVHVDQQFLHTHTHKHTYIYITCISTSNYRDSPQADISVKLFFVVASVLPSKFVPRLIVSGACEKRQKKRLKLWIAW
jgi:hypothetical protein